jgi:gluconolactonase
MHLISKRDSIEGMSQSKILVASLVGAALLAGTMAAQQKGDAPKGGAPKGAPAFTNPAPPHDYTITAIPGVINAGAKWAKAWEGDHTADGMAGTKDGGLLMAQEQTNGINKIDSKDKATLKFLPSVGPGGIGFTKKGDVIVVERGCTDPGLKEKVNQCADKPAVVQLTPTRKVLADNMDGKGLGRVNDLVVSSTGHVYFTQTGLFHMDPSGKVTQAGENLFTNGVMLSPDEKTLYVTNRASVAAFDVQKDGSLKNQREFGKLKAGGDGMAIDAQGRLYVTMNDGVEVLDKTGKSLGLIPTPRAAITTAFSGPGKKFLYVGTMGATIGPNGTEFATTPAERNTAMTVYKLEMLTPGYKGRAK